MSNDKIVIRMYNVGFGDCFFVRLNLGSTIHKILFDCGTIKSGPRTIEDVVRDVIDEARDPDQKPRIDVIVATHRHRDHVSGFANPLWKSVEVQEVWMPWTEDPDDPKAQKIRNSQSRLASALDYNVKQKIAVWKAAKPSQEDQRLITIAELAANALTNVEAMQTLHEGFAGHPVRRFFSTVNPANAVFECPNLPGVSVNVLGPSRDEKVIRDMDPPASQSYLQLCEEKGSLAAIPEPFREDWWLNADPPIAYLLSASDRTKVTGVSSDSDFIMAAALDKAVNGTSLMLLLKIAGQCLLFPGDAQWGTWQAALENPKFAQILAKTTFYKVGHHGSHNATPVKFVEQTLGNDFLAMVSTYHVEQWPNIPREHLLIAMGKKSRNIARSDKESETPSPPFRIVADRYIETEIPLAL